MRFMGKGLIGGTTKDGGTVTTAPDGRDIFNAAIPNFAASINASNNISDNFSNAITHQTSVAQAQGVSLAEAQRESRSNVTQFSESIIQGSQQDSRFGYQENNSRSRDFQTLLRESNDLALKNNTTQEDALNAILSANASAGLQVFGMGGRVEALGQYRNAYSGSISYDDALAAGSSEQVSEALNRTVRTSFDQTNSEQYGNSASFVETVSANSERVESLTETRDAALRNIDSLEKGRSQVETNSRQINQNLAGPFFDYLAKQEDGTGRTIGSEGAIALVSSRSDEDISTVRKHADNFIEARGVNEFVSSDIAAIYDNVKKEIEGQAKLGDVAKTNAAGVPTVEGAPPKDNPKDVFNADTALTGEILDQAKVKIEKTQEELDVGFAEAKTLSEEKLYESEGELNRLNRRQTAPHEGGWDDPWNSGA